MSEPIVIHVSSDRTGVTFSLALTERRALERRLGIRPSPRIFVAHETRSAFDEIHGSMLRQIVLILTGISEERLKELGTVEFREPVTERLLTNFSF